MKKYDTYKDSGIEWIGEIPEHWENIQIKHLAIGNNTLFLDGDWIESKEIVYDNGDYRYITTGNIGEGKYKEQGNTYITQETFEKLNCTEVVPNDLLISRLNPPIGRSCLVPNLGNKIVTSVDNVILRPSPKYIKNYLVHFFTNINYFEYTSLVGRGATMQRISRSMLGDIKIALPPTTEEQIAIANYLDRKTSEIDKLIADKKRLLELYEEEKTAIINQAVTGKWKMKNGKWKMKDSGIEWLGEIPEHWEVKRLKYVLKINSGEGIKSENIKTDGIYPVYGGNGILGYTSNYNSDKMDIIIGRVGAKCGNVRLVYGEKWISDNALVASLISNVDIKFITIQMQSMNLNNLANQNAQPLITGTMIKEKEALFPPIAEQHSIVQYIETETARINQKVAKTEKLIELLTEYRQALISEVVTGKVKVTEELRIEN